MIVRKGSDVTAETPARGVALRTLLAEEQGAPRFAMRVFDIEPGASTPYHEHWWEHEVFVLAGTGVVRTAEGDTALTVEDAVLVSGGEMHCFLNTGATPFRFICCIPTATAQPPAPAAAAPECDTASLPTR